MIIQKIFLGFLTLLFIGFSSCKQGEERIETKLNSQSNNLDLEKLLPTEVDFSAEPMLVSFKEKREIQSFKEYRNIHLAGLEESKKKVVAMILEQIEPFNFIKSVTGVYVEHLNNVSFSIVYNLFDSPQNAEKAIQYIEQLYKELIGNTFKEVNDKRIMGENQKVEYTLLSEIPVYLALYRRDNIVVMLFVPTKSVFPRVLPISAVKFPYKDRYYYYRGLPEFARVDTPKIAELKVPTDDYYIPNTSMLREMAEERSKLWMDYFTKFSSNAESVVSEFFKLSKGRYLDLAMAFVDLRNTKELIPMKFPEWYKSEIENKFGTNVQVRLASKKPLQPRYSKIHMEGGVRYQYPKLGFADYEFLFRGDKQTRKAKITFSVFGNYLKIVDINIL